MRQQQLHLHSERMLGRAPSLQELAESLQKGMTDAAGQSLVFRLRSIEQNRPVVKGHTQLILRASTLVEKENWLTR